uniref:Uncharacterized protein n=1 Tax=Fagus sylvatica TaxID=28930 RepID=A0A2N9FW26_FAGSY
MGRKKKEKVGGKLSRFVNTPEAMAVFRHVYEIPNDVRLRYVHWSDALNPLTGDLFIPVVAIVEGGIRFPMGPLLADFLSYFRLSPSQINPNVLRMVMGTVELNRRLGLGLCIYDIVRTYILHHNTKTDAYSLCPRDVNFTLVNSLPDTNCGFDDDFLIVSGEWFLPGRKCPTRDGVPAALRPLLLRYVAQTHSYLACRLVSNIQAARANPANLALPAVDIQELLDVDSPDMSGINLRNLLPARSREGTSKNVLASSQPTRRKRGRVKSPAGPSRLATSTPPSPLAPEAHETVHHVTQLGNVIQSGMHLRFGAQSQGEGSVPLWAPQMEYRGEDAVTEADCILPVNNVRSASVASAISQAVRLPLDMGEWKKATNDELINNLRRGLLMGVQASLELKDRFRIDKDHLAHANVLASKYQDAKKMAAEAKKLAEATDAKRVEAEESLSDALDSLTKVEDKIRTLESEFKQAKKAAYEAGSNDAQAEMGDQLPRVCNEFFSDGWKKAVSFLRSGQRTLTLEPPIVPYPGAHPPPPPGFVLATPLEAAVTPVPEVGTDVVDLEDGVNSAEAAAPDDAGQVPNVPDRGSATLVDTSLNEP